MTLRELTVSGTQDNHLAAFSTSTLHVFDYSALRHNGSCSGGGTGTGIGTGTGTGSDLVLVAWNGLQYIIIRFMSYHRSTHVIDIPMSHRIASHCAVLHCAALHYTTPHETYYSEVCCNRYRTDGTLSDVISRDATQHLTMRYHGSHTKRLSRHATLSYTH